MFKTPIFELFLLLKNLTFFPLIYKKCIFSRKNYENPFQKMSETLLKICNFVKYEKIQKNIFPMYTTAMENFFFGKNTSFYRTTQILFSFFFKKLVNFFFDFFIFFLCYTRQINYQDSLKKLRVSPAIPHHPPKDMQISAKSQITPQVHLKRNNPL